MKSKLLYALALAGLLSGCAIFHKGDHRPKTAVLGERLPVLTSENDAQVEPALADIEVAVPAPAVNDGWPQPGGNPSKSMGDPALAPSLSRVWSAKIRGSSPKERYGSGPVIANGTVYAIDTAAVVHAFSLSTGRSLWQTETGTEKRDRDALFGGGVSYDAGRLYATNGLGDVAALDAKTGKLIWKVRPGGPLRGAPTIGPENLYVLSQDNQLFALKVDTGEVAWTESATLETAGVFGVGAPAFAQGTVVAGFSSGELSALRYENGRVVWQDQLSRTSISTSVSSISDIDASPVIDQGKVYAIGEGGRMVAMDLTSGQRLWEINIAGIDTPWLAGDWLFVVTDEAKLLCIQSQTGKVRWMTQLRRWKDPKTRNKPIEWWGPVLAGGRLLVTSSRGDLVTVAVANGRVVSSIHAGKSFSRGPVVANNTMVLLDQKGSLTAWR